jgi:2-polyprenyl-6-methoxyphenol hydroxylase-like FAD-dependent oxidoreductase
VRAEQESVRESLTWDDVAGRVVQRMGIEVQRVNWFSTYRVHHRVASAFQQGRAFLLGDAAHIHSPVGGQGMNTGIGDAVNLAWKLADVLRGRARRPCSTPTRRSAWPSRSASSPPPTAASRSPRARARAHA